MGCRLPLTLARCMLPILILRALTLLRPGSRSLTITGLGTTPEASDSRRKRFQSQVRHRVLSHQHVIGVTTSLLRTVLRWTTQQCRAGVQVFDWFAIAVTQAIA